MVPPFQSDPHSPYFTGYQVIRAYGFQISSRQLFSFPRSLTQQDMFVEKTISQSRNDFHPKVAPVALLAYFRPQQH